MRFFCSNTNMQNASFLGTSITANGAYAASALSNTLKSPPYPNITGINLGIGGSTSWYALASQISLAKAANPNIVSIEFAVNDSTSSFYAAVEEALIRRLREVLPDARLTFIAFPRVSNPAINDATNLNSVQHSRWKSICEHYGVFFYSFADDLYQLVNVNGATLANYLSDTVHPTTLGHQTAGAGYSSAILGATTSGPMPVLPERIYDCEDLEEDPTVRNAVDNDGETGNWTTSGTDRLSSVSGSTIRWTAVCASMGINHTSSGVIRHRVDGGAWSANRDLSMYGAGTELTSSGVLPRASHTIEIEVISGTVQLKRFLAV